MTLVVNGETRDVADAASVADLLLVLDVRAGRVAVEINEEVVPRAAFAERRLAAGDRVEIVNFVGGG
jgi:thiamine biosynthesis protein ThiS